MANLTETAKRVIDGKKSAVVTEDKDFFKKFKKGGDKDDAKKNSDKDDDEDDDDEKDSKDSKLAKCKKLVAADKGVKEENIDEISKEKLMAYKKKAEPEYKELYLNMKNKRKMLNRGKSLDKADDKIAQKKLSKEEEEGITEVDKNNIPDRGAKAMKKFKGQWKRLLKMDVGDEVAKMTDDGEIPGVITDFVGYDDGQVTDVVIEWDYSTKNEDGTTVEEIVPVEEIETLDEAADPPPVEADETPVKAAKKKIVVAKEDEQLDEKSERTNRFSDEHDTSKDKRSSSYARKLLDKKKQDMKEHLIDEDETAAQDSLHPNTHPANDPKAGHDGQSRLALISKMIGATHAMSDDECVAWLTKSLATIGHEADKEPNSAESNRATLKTYDPKVVVTGEDVAALFDGQELSEEFKTKTSALFEAAVAAKASIVKEEIETTFAEVLAEQMGENEDVLNGAITELNDKVEMYLDYVAAEWLKENEVAVESSLRSEMTTSFMKGLKDLFTEHYVDIPEDAVDVVEELSAKNAELESRLDDLIVEKHELEESIRKAVADELFAEAANGLSTSNIEKFRVLAEDVEYNGEDKKYQEKLAFIREAHFKLNGGLKKTKVDLEDSFSAPAIIHENVSPEMLPYVRAISKHVPRMIEPKKANG